MSQPEVTIEQGTLRGSVGTDFRGNNFYKFQGIPYAKPPLGELRFKAPVPPEKWTGTFDATKEGEVSYHRDPLKNGAKMGGENCLVLNIYTKTIDDTKLVPVLFWIHGGGLVFGQGGEEYYGPDFLISEDVVVVTFNYRLGLLGFLNFEDPSLQIPGNAGLKDQVMALKWVNKNISKFGGDPNNVTIFGESAGGASVHLHVLSPLSKGLFHKAIAQSGCAINPWVEGVKGISKLAPAMNLEGSDERTIYDHLMKLSAEEILTIQDKMVTTFMPHEIRPVCVVVETNTEDPFLPDEPINIMKSGNFNQVPFMLGFTSCEGMLYDLFLPLILKGLQEIPFEYMVPHYLGYKSGSLEIKAVGEKMRKFYYGNERPSEKNVAKRYELLSDASFIHGIYTTIMTHLPKSENPIFLYRMSIDTELNMLKRFLQIKTPGVCHLDDCGYLFKHSATPEIKPGSPEELGVIRFIRLWSNFARFGNPTPDKHDPFLQVTWKPVSGTNLSFLDIGNELVSKYNLPEIERMNFWKKIVAESPARELYK